jgi:hypothetical protein
MAASSLQKARIIEYERGNLRILSRRKLLEVACERFTIVHAQLGAYLKTGKAIRPSV